MISMTALIRKIQIQKYIFILTWLFCFSIPFRFWNGSVAFFSMLIFLFWILEGNLKDKLYLIGKNKVFIVLLIFLGFNGLSLLWTDYLKVGIRTLNPYKYYLLIMPPLITSIPKEKVPGLVFAVMLGISVHAALTYIILIFEITAPFSGKIYSPYAIYAPLTAFCALYYLNRFFQKNNLKKDRIICLILFMALVVLLFIKPGRSGQIGFLVSLMVLVFLYYGKTLKTISLLAVALSDSVRMHITTAGFAVPVKVADIYYNQTLHFHSA